MNVSLVCRRSLAAIQYLESSANAESHRVINLIQLCCLEDSTHMCASLRGQVLNGGKGGRRYG
jgi:hypothetical protein